MILNTEQAKAVAGALAAISNVAISNATFSNGNLMIDVTTDEVRIVSYADGEVESFPNQAAYLSAYSLE